MQNGRQRLKYNTLFGILQTKFFCHVLIITIQRLNGDVFLERVVNSLATLDIQLDICKIRMSKQILKVP